MNQGQKGIGGVYVVTSWLHATPLGRSLSCSSCGFSGYIWWVLPGLFQPQLCLVLTLDCLTFFSSILSPSSFPPQPLPLLLRWSVLYSSFKLEDHCLTRDKIFVRTQGNFRPLFLWQIPLWPLRGPLCTGVKRQQWVSGYRSTSPHSAAKVATPIHLCVPFHFLKHL